LSLKTSAELLAEFEIPVIVRLLQLNRYVVLYRYLHENFKGDKKHKGEGKGIGNGP